MGAVKAPCQADNRPAGTLIPVRGTETRKCRHNIAARTVRNRLGKYLAFAGLFKDVQLIAEPLNCCSRHKHAAFQRIKYMIFKSNGYCCDQAVFAHNRGFPGVHQKEAACSVGILHISRVDAALPE